MSEDTNKSFSLEDDTETNDLDVNDAVQSQDTQWLDDLRVALERGCDLGAIRNIGKCRALTDDLRLRVWKVSIAEKGEQSTRLCAFRFALISMKMQPKRILMIVILLICHSKM